MESQTETEKTTPIAADETPSKPKEVTKRSIRVETWQKIKEQRISPHGNYNVFNKIPHFNGAEKAAELLADTEEFKKAKSIKVNIDISQEPVKLEVIKAGKTLFVPPSRLSCQLFCQIKCPADADLATQKKIIKLQGEEDTFTGIEYDNESKVKLDMIVVGSCAVSRTGQRIGKGNGYVDLDIGILSHLGIITKDTLIVTTVHDTQVYDTLPSELFKKYDLPLDLIVTPTEVIRVQKRLPRPTGLHWELLSSRRLEIVPVLKLIKSRDEAAGHAIELKSEDTDVESFSKPKQRRPYGRNPRMRRRRSARPVQNGDDENHDESEKKEGENKRIPRRRRFRRNGKKGNRDQSNKENDESGQEKSEGDTKTEKRNGEARPRRQRNKSSRSDNNRRQERDLCIKVSNISKSMRIKDLKSELRTRGCHPMFITWKGFYGKCYLHFLKKAEQDEDEACKELLTQLENLTLTVNKPDEQEEKVDLICEIMKRKEGAATEEGEGTNIVENNRIETTDVTSV